MTDVGSWRERRLHPVAARLAAREPRAHRLALLADLGAQHRLEVLRHVLVRPERPHDARRPLERVGELGRRREALRPIALEGLGHDRLERTRGWSGAALRTGGIGSLSTRLSVSASPSPLKRRRQASTSQSTMPEAKMSARRSMSLRALRLLGRHVRELALELPGARRRQLARRARDAEVAEARAAVDADQHVLRRDVAVHDAERLAVVVLAARARRRGPASMSMTTRRPTLAGSRTPVCAERASRRPSVSPSTYSMTM